MEFDHEQVLIEKYEKLDAHDNLREDQNLAIA
jgi:hypothetical protein